MQAGNTKNKVMETLVTDNKAAFSVPKIGDIIEGTLISKTAEGIFFDIGPFGTGIIFGRELRDSHRAVKELKEGDSVQVKIYELDNDKGYVEVSLKDAGEELTWDDLRTKKTENEVFPVTITNSNKGGLLAEINHIQAFLPVSQLSSEHYPRVEGGDKMKISQELRKLVGESLEVKILDINSAEGKIILSEKTATQLDSKELLKNFEVGQTIEGEISGVVDFGAFIKFQVPKPKEKKKTKKNEGEDEKPKKDSGPQELEGLIHISEFDWRIISHPEEVVKVGDRVKAKIIDVTDGKISLSLKALKKDPWEGVEEKYKKGTVVKGTITKFNPFGAFVELEENIQGLIHISEFGTETHMKEVLELGKKYSFTILLVDLSQHRIALALEKKESKTESKKPKATPTTIEQSEAIKPKATPDQ